MSEMPEPAHLVPAGIAAVLAAMLRAASQERPKSLPALIADTVATMSLTVIAYYILIGHGLDPNLTAGVSAGVAAMGWDVAMRILRKKLGQ
jgi:hypothetical protein